MPPAKTFTQATALGDGLLGARLLDGAGGASALEWPGVKGWRPGTDTLWVHLDRTAEAAQEWLHDGSGIPELVVEALLAEDTRARYLVHPEGMLVILRAVNLNPGADPDDMISLRLWLEPERLVSLRAPRLAAVGDVVESLDRGAGPRDAVDLLVRLATCMCDHLGPVVDNLEEQVEAILDEAAAGGVDPARRVGLVEVRRQAVGLRRYVAPQRDVFSGLPHERPDWFPVDRADRLRELSERVARFVEDLEAVLSHAAIANDAIESAQADRLNRKMYLLSIITGVFLPLGLITGLLGINVWVPGQSWGEDLRPFAVVCGILVTVAIVQVIIFRRKRWL